ncbi:HopJ type III effector protein [Saccharicrinis aurantiacus]|uniref:HopJ type III effector protein n=1 Tax=Saccharicrinis aurantiacus TaxID=1849719 RepID=UPI001115156B|nr:HopJ type III effector protein [Saccharicrinis aurantiacus]
MNLSEYKNKLKNSPESIEFAETMDIVDQYYSFTPTEFKNGEVVNEEGKNNGSCKLFAFAQIQKFTKEETLMCFGKFYTKDVLENPNGDDHQNIRNFITHGWDGINFKGVALQEK